MFWNYLILPSLVLSRGDEKELTQLPYPPFNFDLVIDLRSLTDNEPTVSLDELKRVTRPQGGVLVYGAQKPPKTNPGDGPGKFTAIVDGTFVVSQRGKDEGTRNWTHNYATAANTYGS